MNLKRSVPEGDETTPGLKEASITMIDYTTNPRRGEAYLSEDDPVRGRTPELYLTLFDPTSEEDQPALAVPASLLMKLWPGLAPALTEVEGRLRAFGL